MSQPPIFIHSLFRSGSTYFFNVFRRSPAGYFCFQESLHPVVFHLRENPQELLKFHTATYELMRHPNLDKPVFYEVASVSSAWKEKITYSAIFDGYFGSDQADNGVEFFRAILDNVEEGRPVFEECRTAGRIGILKEQLGGFHIYLWRNPWDQWWSYKTIDHLDYQNREIINAPNSFNAISRLRSQLSFQKAYTDPVLQTQDGVFTSEESYLAFYLLWLLGLHEGIKQAHLLINIDKLTESETYREEIMARLANDGIDRIDFSDCKVPQSNYFEEDRKFFIPLEEQIHEWLKKDFTSEELDQLHNVRKKYQPKNLSEIIDNIQIKNYARQITQIRAISRRFETSKALSLQHFLQTIDEYNIKIQDLTNKYNVLEKEKNNIEQEKNYLLTTLNEIYNSRTWQLSLPLRWIENQVRLLRRDGIRSRLVALMNKANKD